MDVAEFELPEWRETVAETLSGVRVIIPRARRAFGRLSEEQKDLVDEEIESLRLLALLENFHAVVRRGSPIKKILNILGSFILALGDFIGGLEQELSAALKALGRALIDISIKFKDQAIEELERKLDFIMDRPPGEDVPIPPPPGVRKPVPLTEIKKEVEEIERNLRFIMDLPVGAASPAPPPAGTAPVSLTLLKIKLDNLADRLGRILIGRGIPIEPGETVPRFPHPIKAEIEDLEKKLDFIMDLPAGVAIPPPPPAGTAPVSLTLLKLKLDNLADRLGDILIGAHIPIEPDETVTRFPHPIKAEIEDLERKLDFIMDLPEGAAIPPPPPVGTKPVSLTEIKKEIEDVEKKLHFIMDLPAGADIPPPPPAGISPVSLTEIKKEIEDIEKKLHFIMDLPAGAPIPPPPPAGTKPVSLTEIEEKLHFIMDLPKGAPIPPPPPAGTKPVSLTQIEKKLDFIMDLPDGEPIPPVPPGVRPVSLTQVGRKLDTVKKIFVAAEATFAAASINDARVIDITAPAGGTPPFAFDLSGWVDLTRMRNGDVMGVKVEVSFAGRPDILFNEATFADVQTRGLKHFRDIADGVQAAVGTNVRITINQLASADNFLLPVEVAYQFIVESP